MVGGMINSREILETIRMIDAEHLDVRTITMGICLRDCADSDAGRARERVYEKITRCAERLVRVGEEISAEYGIPIINKRIAVTPISQVAAASRVDDYVSFARTLDEAARTVGVNFIGRFPS